MDRLQALDDMFAQDFDRRFNRATANRQRPARYLGEDELSAYYG